VVAAGNAAAGRAAAPLLGHKTAQLLRRLCGLFFPHHRSSIDCPTGPDPLNIAFFNGRALQKDAMACCRAVEHSLASVRSPTGGQSTPRPTRPIWERTPPCGRGPGKPAISPAGYRGGAPAQRTGATLTQKRSIRLRRRSGLFWDPPKLLVESAPIVNHTRKAG
jgi:hypothetical protein